MTSQLSLVLRHSHQPHNPLHYKSTHSLTAFFPSLALRCENSESEKDFGQSHQNTQDNQHNDDPRDPRHFHVRNTIRKNFREVQEDTTSLVEDLNTWLDFEVLSDGGV